MTTSEKQAGIYLPTQLSHPLRLIHMSATESEAKVIYKEPQTSSSY